MCWRAWSFREFSFSRFLVLHKIDWKYLYLRQRSLFTFLRKPLVLEMLDSFFSFPFLQLTDNQREPIMEVCWKQTFYEVFPAHNRNMRGKNFCAIFYLSSSCDVLSLYFSSSSSCEIFFSLFYHPHLHLKISWKTMFINDIIGSGCIFLSKYYN